MFLFQETNMIHLNMPDLVQVMPTTMKHGPHGAFRFFTYGIIDNEVLNRPLVVASIKKTQDLVSFCPPCRVATMECTDCVQH